MRRQRLLSWFAIVAICALAGCKTSVPNAVFSCAEDIDCPAGFFCHQSQFLCFDTPEVCVPTRSCDDEVYECGVIDNGCGESLDCGACLDPDVCGAEGSPFACGCESFSCTDYDAECGIPPTGCDPESMVVLNCAGSGSGGGGCPADFTCNANFKCECIGSSCNSCMQACSGQDLCIGGMCVCQPQNCMMRGYECSSYAGNQANDGCGTVSENELNCGSCSGEETCGVWGNNPFTCGGCTCKDRGYECGKPEICGSVVNAQCGFARRIWASVATASFIACA